MKKNVVKRLLTSLLTVSMAAMLLAGCGGNSSSSSSSSSSESAAAKTEESAPAAESEAAGTEAAAEEGAGTDDTFIADRTITVQVYVDDIGNTLPDDLNNTPVMQEITKRTGIKLDINYTPGESDGDVLSAQLASGTIPDVIFCYLNNSTRPEFSILKKAANEGMFADVSEYMANSKVYCKYMEEGYLPADSYQNIVFRDDWDEPGVYLLHLSIDQKDTSLDIIPEEEYIGGMWIQKRIVDDLGIDPKTINTMDQFYDLLVQIKEKGYTDDNGNPVYPLGPKYWGGSPDALQYIITGYDWGVSDGYNIDEDGNVKHVAETDHVYDGINFIRKLLAENLINPEFFTMDSTRAEEVSKNHNSAIMADCHNYVDIIYESDDWVPLGPLNDISGDNKEIVSGKGGYGCMAISADAENPEEIFKFFDWLSTYEGQLLAEYGVEGLSYNMVDGYPVLTDEAMQHVNAGDEDWMINSVGAAFGGSGNYFFEFALTDRNNLEYFGESRPGANSEDSSYARSVELVKEYQVEKKLVPGLSATAYLSADEMADVNAQMSLLDWDETFVQACFASSDEEVTKIIESFRSQLKAAGVEKFEEYVKSVYEEDPTLVSFFH